MPILTYLLLISEHFSSVREVIRMKVLPVLLKSTWLRTNINTRQWQRLHTKVTGIFCNIYWYFWVVEITNRQEHKWLWQLLWCKWKEIHTEHFFHVMFVVKGHCAENITDILICHADTNSVLRLRFWWVYTWQTCVLSLIQQFAFTITLFTLRQADTRVLLFVREQLVCIC